MTDDTTLPEIPSQLRRTSSPGFITGSAIRPTAAATRARESKIRKSIKTVTPVKARTSIYAQMLRWSFALTLLVSAVIVGFMVLAAQSGNPPFYLFAILAGSLGAFMSTLIRLYHYEELPKLVESRGLDRLRRSDLGDEADGGHWTLVIALVIALVIEGVRSSQLAGGAA